MTACVVCASGEVREGTTTLTAERGEMTLVLRAVPARVCDHCAEAYFDEATTRRIEVIVETSRMTGVAVAVQNYGA